MIKNKYTYLMLPVLVLTVALGLMLGKPLQETARPEISEWNGSFAEGWRQFQELTGAQKYEAASSLLDKMLARARGSKNGTEWTRCLIRYTQLRIALHGYETAVRFLKEQPWPDDWVSSSVLNLFYAQALATYAHSYSWEINQREKTESGKGVDLKAWTRDQIYEEAQKAFEVVWNVRNRLGGLPAAEWKDYIVPNNYPAGIRPTLRDAVSYLRVELLADTNGWRPEQLNEIYRLSLKDLMAGAAGDLSLVDPSRHPLEKISFILADLESWHAERRQPEAALEARLERYRHLHGHFSESGDKKLIEDALEQHLKPLADFPWWSEGMAQLADFVRAGEEPDSLPQARQIATQGNAAFPQSYGGRHCLAIKTGIEAPDYAISGMRNDNTGKKSILVTHKNLSKVFFRAYAIDLQHIIETSDDYNLLPSGQDLEKILDAGSPALQWDVSLPETPDYRMHKTFVIPPVKKAGAYLVVASGRSDFSKTNNRLQAIYTTFGDLALVTRQYGMEAEVTVLSGSTGRPVSGALVILYRYDWNTRHSRRESKLSAADGTATFRVDRIDSPHFLFASLGGQVTLDDSHLYFGQRGTRARSSTLLFTDRSIYRPTQKIFWKAVAYDTREDDSHLGTEPGRVLTVSLRDMNDQVVESRTVTTNGFGTASGEFFIPSGRALGQWFLESSGTRAAVRVEEYRRPTFETKIQDSEEPLRLNQPARITGEAKYFFGLPVSSGQVKWNVKRQPVLPWWWGYFSWTGRAPDFSSPQVIAGGTASLKEDGTFSFTFSPEADERLGKNKEISYRYSVSVDVTDEGGETRSAQRSFRLGFISVEASAVMEKSFFLENDRPAIKVVRKNLDGAPKPGKGTWRIAELKAPSRTLLPAEQPLFVPEELKDRTGYQTAGDRERERWNHLYNPEAVLFHWETGVTRASGSLTHSVNGEGAILTSPLAPGAYRLIYETTDDFGAKCELQKNFVVAAPSLRLPIPAIFLPEKTSVQVGDTARFLVHSGLTDQPMLFEIYRDGRRIRRTQFTSGKDPSVLELPITESDRGGLWVSLSLLRDNQIVRLENALIIPWDNKRLKVEFSTFRDRLRPGKEETWSVKVKSMDGRDAAVPAAELLAYMYDRSLDAFVPHSPVNPVGLYPYRGESVPARSNLGEAPVQWLRSSGFSTGAGFTGLTRDYLSFYGGYGIGGVGVRGGVAAASVGYLNRDAISPAPRMMLESSSSVGRVDEPKKKAEGENRPETAAPNVELRTEFSETAFWYPHLLTNEDGSVTFEFKVPDSVTSWNVWVHAITRDLKSGSVSREARSVKELMVRPYLPRFLREGDEAEIKVVVNNASDKELKGSLNFDIVDVATGESILPSFFTAKSSPGAKPFSVPAGGGTNLTFPVKTPSKVGQVAFKVTATSGDFSDGELRPIPILPGRMHLMQSRFVTLKDPGRRVIRFEDLARNDDPTRINEQMVVTLDAQLFYSVLSALPYLVNYPYECTEQTLNRFLSTGILSSLYQQYPAIDRMAKEFSSRQTHFEQWDAPDPNRKMALEETPWLQMAKGGKEESSDLINVLDSRIAKAQRETALALLRKSQTSSGGFPWFPGGPPSPFITLYLLHGFSKALEFGIDVPREMVRPAWDYTHRHYLDEIVREMMAGDSGWEFVTFINYVLSNYPDSSWYANSFTPAERKTMLDFSFKHWKAHSPYLKGYLALTLKRMGRPKDAMLVWESVMDSAKTAEDQGTFWAPEDRGWLWYNDTIETHAFAIRTEMELLPDDTKLDGMVLWIFLNKKMNHWKSTRATAEVIYSLAHYLKRTGQLGIREDAAVTVGTQKTSFVFEPDQYTGKKNQIAITGENIDPQTTSSISIEKTGKGYLFASATWHFSTERLPDEERGDYLRLSRSYFKRVNTGREFSLQPILDGATLEPGDEVEVHLSLTSKHPMEYVHLRDPRAAGFEPSNNTSRHKWNLGIAWYEEIRDSGTNFFFEHLPQGEHTFKYRVRAATAGTFRVAPATAQPMYAPEFAAYSTGAVLSVQ